MRARPKAASPDPSAPPLGGYALIGGDDAKTVEDKTASLLEAYSKSQGGAPLPFEKQTIAGHEMNVVPDPNTKKMLAGYGFWDNYLVAGYQEDALTAGFAAGDDPMANNAHFKAVSSRLPAKNYGYFYMDIDAARTLIEETPSLGLDKGSYASDVKPFLEPLRAFGSASDANSSQNGVMKGTMFLLIAEK